MAVVLPAPATTLVVLIGASEYVRDRKLSNLTFKNSARAVLQYFEDPAGFALPRKNLLDLFDSLDPPSRQGDRIRQFLQECLSRPEAQRPIDVILYYIGHGSFDENQYLLSLGDSLPDAPDTKYRFKHLHQAIKSEARNTRKYFILDSCFSGAALRELMSESAVTKLVIDEVREGAKDDEPGKGTALLCAADSQNPARAPAEENYTMFSGAFLEALQWQEGSPDRLSLQQVRYRAYDIIKNKFRASAVRPEVHSPDQSQGDIASIPLLAVRDPAAMSLSRTATVGAPATPKVLLGTGGVGALPKRKKSKLAVLLIITGGLLVAGAATYIFALPRPAAIDGTQREAGQSATANPKEVARLAFEKAFGIQISDEGDRWGGVLVTYVPLGSPANKAHVSKNDVIVGIDQDQIKEAADVTKLMEKLKSAGTKAASLVITDFGGDHPRVVVLPVH